MGIPDRQLLLMTVVVSAAASAVAFVSSGGDWVQTLVALPIFVTFSFWSIRISRWIARRFVPVAEPPGPAEPRDQSEPTSRRPEHARRRRQRRRRGKR